MDGIHGLLTYLNRLTETALPQEGAETQKGGLQINRRPSFRAAGGIQWISQRVRSTLYRHRLEGVPLLSAT